MMNETDIQINRDCALFIMVVSLWTGVVWEIQQILSKSSMY